MRTELIKTTILTFLCSLTVIAENRVVTLPLYTQRNLIRIDKLEISPVETSLHCIFRTFYPESSRGGISSKSYLQGKSGKIYKIIDSEGITLDEQIYSYNPLKILLRFEPLDENEKVVHFVELSKDKSDYSLSDILTYKPESVKPFTCTIKGQVVGFYCENIRFDVGENFNRLADGELIPVVDGKFELSKEYNFIEKYSIYPEEKNPMKAEGVFSQFYISEGVINVVMNSKVSNKGNEISGDLPAVFSYDNTIDMKNLIQGDTSIYKQYYYLTNEHRDLPSGTVLVRVSSPYYFLDEIRIISPKDTAELRRLQNQITKTRAFVEKDSLCIEIVKIKQSANFYIKEAIPVIEAINEADKRNTERYLNILTENPSISKFYELEKMLSGIRNTYPKTIGFSYSENEGETYINEVLNNSSKEKADEMINKLLEIYEDTYKEFMPHHPLNAKISNDWHNNRIKQATRFFEACSRINFYSSKDPPTDISFRPINTIRNEEINKELEQVKGYIAKAIEKKDDLATEIINLFATSYMPIYPDHTTTKEIRKMIRIASDDLNPNKWRNTPTTNPESLSAVFEFLKKHRE